MYKLTYKYHDRDGELISHRLPMLALNASNFAGNRSFTDICITSIHEAKSLPEITEGSFWQHRNGAFYEVLHIANVGDNYQDERYPVTVVYRGRYNGKIWARRADDWHRSMTYMTSREP